jgi:cytosine/adenosine deaminase-related metal-dependent hydrolase
MISDVAALAYAEMLEAGFTTVGEFHYLHNAANGSPYADPAETAGRIVAAAADSGIGLTLLPCCTHGGCAAGNRQARSSALPLRSRWLLASLRRPATPSVT